jgi:membrane-associated protease RseP (regulator of RpoE activity)
VLQGNASRRWLNVTALGPAASGRGFPDINPKLPPGRPRIGVVIDQAFGGPGVLVKEIQEGMPAAALGIKPLDVIVGLDGAPVGDMADLQGALRAKKHGDGFKISLRRGEETLEKEGTFPEAKPEEALRRGQPYGSIRADVKENVVEVRANGIRSFEILLSEPLFDLANPVVVRVNGETVHSGVVAPDLRFLTEQAALDQDRAMVYLARLSITVGAKGP